MSETEAFTLAEIITQPEYSELVDYLNAAKHGSLHMNITDWLATKPVILEKMNRRKLLLNYFAYLIEASLTKQPR